MTQDHAQPVNSAHAAPDSFSLFDARLAVVGLGGTGRAVVDVALTLGASVHAVDRSQQAVEALLQGTDSSHAHRLSVQACDDDEQMAQSVLDSNAPLVVISPGVPAHAPVMVRAQAAGREVISEVELAWRLQGASARPTVPWLAITGTDGKTTTVSMLASMLSAAGLQAPAVGNVGTPIIQAVAEGKADVLAVELSSFQLHTTSSMSPLASICLNVAPDHLDWHGGFENYRADKARVYEHTQLAAVYNAADPQTYAMVEEADVVEGCRAVGITTEIPGLGQLGCVEDLLVDRAFHAQRHNSAVELAALQDLAHLAPGGRAESIPEHLVCDALAASALARAAGLEPTQVRDGLRDFQPGAHRIVTVGQSDGVTWVDDSKATNPHAAQAALSALPEHTGIWIAGGDTKGARFDELVQRIHTHLRAAVVIGKDTSAIETALRAQAPQLPYTVIGDGSSEEVIQRAVHASAEYAQSGDTVMLAPACASWDQFDSYSQRGDLFAQAVQQRIEGQ